MPTAHRFTSATLMECLLCIICNTNSFHSFYTNLAYIQISSKILGRCVCGGWGGGQLIYIVSPNRYVNIQSVFWRRRSRAEFGFVLWSTDFFQNPLFQKIFQEYNQDVKQFGSRSRPTFCWSYNVSWNLGSICLQSLSVVFTEGVDRGGRGTGIEGAESGVEGAESGVEGAGSGSRGGGKWE